MKKISKRVVKFTFIFIALLGWAPLWGLYFLGGTRFGNDPNERVITPGISMVTYSYFDPKMVEEIEEILFYQSQYAYLQFGGFHAGGVYDPIMERIVLAGTRKPLILHEILHHIWFKDLVPFQSEFHADFLRLAEDDKYSWMYDDIQKGWEHSSSQGEIALFRDTELYCSIGEWLVDFSYHRTGRASGLPDYMARHFEGVLNKDLLINYQDRYVEIDPLRHGQVLFEYTKGELTFSVVGPLVSLIALQKYGGVIAVNLSRHHSQIARIKSTKTFNDWERSIAPGEVPTNVLVNLNIYDPEGFRFSANKTEIGIGRLHVPDNPILLASGRWYKLSYAEFQRVHQAYKAAELTWTGIGGKKMGKHAVPHIHRGPPPGYNRNPVSFPAVAPSEEPPAPLSDSTEGFKVVPMTNPAAQQGPMRVITQFVLTNSADEKMTRVQVRLKVTTNDTNVNGVFLLQKAGHAIASADWSKISRTGEVVLDAWGLSLKDNYLMQIELRSTHGVGDMVEVEVLEIRTDKGSSKPGFKSTQMY